MKTLPRKHLLKHIVQRRRAIWLVFIDICLTLKASKNMFLKILFYSSDLTDVIT